VQDDPRFLRSSLFLAILSESRNIIPKSTHEIKTAGGKEGLKDGILLARESH